MNKTLFFLILSLLVVSGCTENRPQEGAETASTIQQDYYTCPMHPSVRSDRPGACPVCGMALVRKTSMQEAEAGDLAQLRHVSLSPTQRVIANVSTEPARVRNIAKTISAAGIVDFAEPLRATVSARFRGRLEKLHVSYAGERVRKGRPLFDLYSPDLVSAQQDYLLALQSSKNTGGDQTLSRGSIQLLRAARDRLSIHFGMTEDQIALLEKSQEVRSAVTFYAPLSGTVITKEILEGQYVDEGTTLYEVADLSRVWVYFDLYENELGYVQEGQEITFSTDASPGQSFKGRVTFVDPILNAETRTARVRTEAPNPRNLLKPRMYATGTLKVQLPSRVTVPTSAVLSMGKRDIVWVEVEPNTFVPKVVRLGHRTSEYTQIIDGLSEGDLVVSTGGYLIDSESALQTPAVGDPHQDHTAARTEPMSAPTEEGLRTFHVHVKGRYQPETIKVRQGESIALDFYREERSACTEEVVFPDFGIRRQLAAFQTTRIEFTPQKKGTFKFTCGMDMVHGTLIVE